MLAKSETAFGIYRKAHNKGAYQWSVLLNGNSMPTGTIIVNSETLTGAKGTLIDNGNGTYKNDYAVNEDIVQYYTDKAYANIMVTSRKNAFEVLKDGRAKVQSAPVDDNDVVRYGDTASFYTNGLMSIEDKRKLDNIALSYNESTGVLSILCETI